MSAVKIHTTKSNTLFTWKIAALNVLMTTKMKSCPETWLGVEVWHPLSLISPNLTWWDYCLQLQQILLDGATFCRKWFSWCWTASLHNRVDNITVRRRTESTSKHCTPAKSTSDLTWLPEFQLHDCPRIYQQCTHSSPAIPVERAKSLLDTSYNNSQNLHNCHCPGSQILKTFETHAHIVGVG